MKPASLETLAAESAIRRLISSYCDCVSRRQPDEAGQLFAHDARIQIYTFPEFVGREAIVAVMRETFAAYTFMHQKCDTGLIDVDGDRARSRLLVMEVNLPPDSEDLAMIFGTYEDEYVLLEEGWRFFRRRFIFETSSRIPVSSFERLQPYVPAFAMAV